MMHNKLILKQDMLDAFKKLGMQQGMTVMMHSSLSSLGDVCGGAQTVIRALLETVTREGTIVMATESWKNLDPDAGVHNEVGSDDWQAIRDNWPPFDKRLTPTDGMGTVAEMFRLWIWTYRSDHPARSIAANGKHATFLTVKHDLSDIYGDTSPMGRLYELDAYVLLIGVGYDKVTSLHLAEARANYPGKHNTIAHSADFECGKRVWKAYETLDVDSEDFKQIGKAFEQTHHVAKVRLGHATLRLIRQRELVDFAVEWMEKNRK